jgi:hypothetical protein
VPTIKKQPPAKKMGRPPWTPEQRARYNATIQSRKRGVMPAHVRNLFALGLVNKNPVVVCSRCGNAVFEGEGFAYQTPLDYFQCTLCGSNQGTRYTPEGGWIYHLIAYRAERYGHETAILAMTMNLFHLAATDSEWASAFEAVGASNEELARDFIKSWTTFSRKESDNDSDTK